MNRQDAKNAKRKTREKSKKIDYSASLPLLLIFSLSLFSWRSWRLGGSLSQRL
jgi:hypothetical protein